MKDRALSDSEQSRRAAIRARWPRLSDEDLEIAGNDRDRLVIRIVDRYGISVEWAEHQISEWEAGD